MSGMEIERKFLVVGEEFKRLAYDRKHIKQGYICSGQGRTVRVRLADDAAYITIKGPSDTKGISRYEFEKEITVDEADHLFALCEPGVIDKTRYYVRNGKHIVEVDEFHGDNQGLVMAEIELASEDEEYERPLFLGREVTGDRRYYNSHLRKFPYVIWGRTQE